jgi:hypothetical protein
MPTCAETRPGWRSRVSSVNCCSDCFAEEVFGGADAGVLTDADVGADADVGFDPVTCAGEQACHQQADRNSNREYRLAMLINR